MTGYRESSPSRGCWATRPHSSIFIPDSSVCWSNVGPTSVLSSRRWPNVSPTYIAVSDVDVRPFKLYIQALIGDKYGPVAPPSLINKEEFETVKLVAEEARIGKTYLLEEWYAMDENYIPPIYVLQVRYSMYICGLGWGLLSQFPPFRYFLKFSALSKHM